MGSRPSIWKIVFWKNFGPPRKKSGKTQTAIQTSVAFDQSTLKTSLSQKVNQFNFWVWTQSQILGRYKAGCSVELAPIHATFLAFLVACAVRVCFRIYNHLTLIPQSPQLRTTWTCKDPCKKSSQMRWTLYEVDEMKNLRNNTKISF